MEMVCCPLSEPDETASVYNVTYPVARKSHRCCECHDEISKGIKHELYKLLFDGQWSSNRTCMVCVEIRDHFNCGGCVLGMLWEDLEENFFPDMTAGGPCMDGLSPAAKARIFEKRLAWVFDHDEYHPCDRALPPGYRLPTGYRT
jgi:hypothetical protein